MKRVLGVLSVLVCAGGIAAAQAGLSPEDQIVFDRVAEIIGDEAASALPTPLIRQLDQMRTNAELGLAPLWVCSSPGASEEFRSALETFNRLQMAIYAGGGDGVQARFQPSARWTTTATNGGGLSIGQPITVTYSFVPDGTTTSNGPSDLFATFDAIYAGVNYTGLDGVVRTGRAAWQQVFKDGIESWGEINNINYVFEPNDDGAAFRQFSGSLGVRGDVRIAGAFIDGNPPAGQGSVLANNSFPNNGDMLMDSADDFYLGTGGNSQGLFNVVAHEHGHGIGLSHTCPVNQLTLMEPSITFAFTGQQTDDRISGMALYGDRFEPNAGGMTDPATDLGTIGSGERMDVEGLSIHNRFDRDVFAIEIAEAGPVMLEVFVAPDGNAFVQGPQLSNGACSAGSLTVFEDVNDLSIELFESGSSLGFIDSSPAGPTESLVVEVMGPGNFEIRVDGGTPNSIGIQPYAMEILAYPMPVTDIAFEDDFDSLATDWTVVSEPGVTDGQWELGDPVTAFGRSAPHNDADGSGFAFLTRNDAADENSDLDDGDTIATSPAFDFTGGGFIRYAYWLDDRLNAIGPEDFLRIETSSDNGATWTIAESFGEGKPRWRRSFFEVPANEASNQFRIRFVAADNAPGDVPEASFDSVTVFNASITGPVSCSIADIAEPFGQIDVFDLIAFLQNFDPMSNCPGDAACAIADLDGSDAIDVFDLILFLQNFDPSDPNCQPGS